ncbi:hypothetical protein [uncultured Nocardioides sp.]|uniref:hypothetical protein n=1 Tax=uncultured Nocardioides sp. TaxID=198441 RepID=UPI0026039556|nr:hypothetical protein [uncultured Nocardioides sp.]
MVVGTIEGVDAVTTLLPLLLSGSMVASVGYCLSVRAAKAAEARAARREAASKLTDVLEVLHDLVKRFGWVDLDQAEVVSAIATWSRESRRQTHLLPRPWRHVGRSVTSAAGEVFGGLALVSVRPDMGTVELPEPDALWRAFVEDYLGLVHQAIVQWGTGGRATAPPDFDNWLRVTGRGAPAL